MGMRAWIAWMMVAMTGCWLVSCGGIGGNQGNPGGGADPPAGGISEVPNPHPAMATKSGKSLSQLQRGHEIYMLKCAECHAYKLPQQIDIGRWTTGRLTTDCSTDLGAAGVRAVVDYVTAAKMP
jgi:hypothetical protein